MTAEDEREAQARIQEDGAALTRAILTRRRIKCRVNDNHIEGGDCPSCGL